jgi:pimeloyl-ACP methyl ester carboxylesterase
MQKLRSHPGSAKGIMNRSCLLFALALSLATGTFAADEPPPKEAFQVLQQTTAPGPRITSYLQYQTEQAWKLDDDRREEWRSIRTEKDLLRVQDELRAKLLRMIGGLPTEKTDLHPRITGKIDMDGFSIEKLIFESLPGVYVTALVYLPADHSTKLPAVLLPAGHSPTGKNYYQEVCQRLAKRGYVVIAWDPAGQGERSQFWDAKAGKSRYNLICAEHAVMGNLAYLAGTNLARWEIWDGIRAVDYLLTRPEVDAERISIVGTSGGGAQAAYIAALDKRIKVAVPSCYITALPMRVFNRIFADPDSDPEQDLLGMISDGLDHPGLLLLMYPRPVLVAAAVLDFFPIEGTHKSFREVRSFYESFNHADRIALTEGYHTHQFSLENQQSAIDFLDHFNHLPAGHKLSSARKLEDRVLQCTRTGQVMLDFDDARSLMDVIVNYYEEHKTARAATLSEEYFSNGYSGINKWPVSEYTGGQPAKGLLSWEFLGSTNSGAASIDRYLLHHSGPLEMPLLFIHKPAKEKRNLLLWFRDDGKATSDNWPEIQKLLDANYDVVSFDFRGLGETKMPYKATSPDDPAMAQLDFDRAYVYPLSSVLADYVYSSVLTGRPYFLQMIEDAEIAALFAREKLGTPITAVTAAGNAQTLASAISETLPALKLLPESNGTVLKWSDLVRQRQELWPIQYLLPSGAYIH